MEQVLVPIPPPSTSPASAKVSCQEANQLETNTFWMIFYNFYWKGKKLESCQGASNIKKLILENVLLLLLNKSKRFPARGIYKLKKQQRLLFSIVCIKKEPNYLLPGGGVGVIHFRKHFVEHVLLFPLKK